VLTLLRESNPPRDEDGAIPCQTIDAVLGSLEDLALGLFLGEWALLELCLAKISSVPEIV
jgi:hypothetical protein